MTNNNPRFILIFRLKIIIAANIFILYGDNQTVKIDYLFVLN